jgi:hypothetical protein
VGAADLDRAGPEGRHLTEPGWHPDPWQPGGYRWHDGTDWTSWTGPPSTPPYAAAVAATETDADGEDRLRPLAQLSIVATAVLAVLGVVVMAPAVRDLLEPLVDLFGDGDVSQADIDDAVRDIERQQGEYWWLNVVGLLPVACLAGMAVWASRVASVARRLGYPARHSPGWAAAGWFVPVVNLWFPYQSIVDCVAPASAERRRVLAWWLATTATWVLSLIAFAVVVLSDAPVAPLAVPVALLAAVQAALGLRVVAVVHDDHRRAISQAR